MDRHRKREGLPAGARRRSFSTPYAPISLLIAATNCDLRGMIAAGRFREDLSYRLNVITITIPPLRERPDDSPDLARHFLAKYSRKMLKPVREFTPDALRALGSYGWPGNVRELESVVERAVILCDAEAIGREDLAVPEATATTGPPAKSRAPARSRRSSATTSSACSGKRGATSRARANFWVSTARRSTLS
jgi:DNA-binding NtrC family response regulator